MPLFPHAASDVGRQRTVNEDSCAVDGLGDDEWMLVVCDGMGGHEGGQLASITAVEFIVGAIEAARGEAEPGPVIGAALEGANAAVLEAAAARGMPGAGTTAVVAWSRGNQFWIGWVGDSRFYRFRGRDIVGKSLDHTRVAEMVNRGILTAAEAKHHPDAHILTRALGGGKGLAEGGGPSVWGVATELQDGDTLLLCSDGLHDLITDEEIPELMAGLTVSSAAAALIDKANERGGHDNITVIVACWNSVTVPIVGPRPPPSEPDPKLEPRITVQDELPPDPLRGGVASAEPAPYVAPPPIPFNRSVSAKAFMEFDDGEDAEPAGFRPGATRASNAGPNARADQRAETNEKRVAPARNQGASVQFWNVLLGTVGGFVLGFVAGVLAAMAWFEFNTTTEAAAESEPAQKAAPAAKTEEEDGGEEKQAAVETPPADDKPDATKSIPDAAPTPSSAEGGANGNKATNPARKAEKSHPPGPAPRNH